MLQNSSNTSQVDILEMRNNIDKKLCMSNDNYLCYLVPTYDSGGDSTECYYLNGSKVVIHKSIKTVLRQLTEADGLQCEAILSTTGLKPKYTDPRTYGPHITMASLKVRVPIGRNIAYGLFNVMVPDRYELTPGKTVSTCYLRYKDFDPILIYHSMHHTMKKLEEARIEHRCYLARWFNHLIQTGNIIASSELFSAYQVLFNGQRYYY